MQESYANKADAKPRNNQSFLRYIALSVVSFGLNLTFTTLFAEVIQIPTRYAYLPTIILLTLINFFAARQFVYPNTNGRLLKQFVGFVASVAVFRISEYAFYYVLVAFFVVDYRIAIIVLSPVFAIGKYAWLKVTVFRSTPDTLIKSGR